MKTKWEMFEDPSFYDMYAIREVGDQDLNSPRLFHFTLKEDAEAFLELIRKAHVAERRK